RFVTMFHQGGFDANGAAFPNPQTGTTPNLFNAIRNGSNGQEGTGIENVTPGRWYIAATSWNTVSGDLRMVFYDDQGVVTDRSFSAILEAGLGDHALTFLGSGSSNSSSGQAFDG